MRTIVFVINMLRILAVEGPGTEEEGEWMA